MKYIRTKDHLEELYIDEFTEYGKEYYKNSKIADTIEELCDEFIIKYFSKIERKYLYLYLVKYEQLKNFNWEKDDDYYIYGAIHIKGENDEPILKSVAKMNENGELELL